MTDLLSYLNCIKVIKEFFDLEEFKETSLKLILDTLLKAVEQGLVSAKLIRMITWYTLNMACVPHIDLGTITAKLNCINNEPYVELVSNDPINRVIVECPSFKNDLRNFYNLETEKPVNACINISKEVLLNSVLRIIVIKALLIYTSPIYMLEMGYSQNNNMSNYEIITSLLGHEFIDEFKKKPFLHRVGRKGQ